MPPVDDDPFAVAAPEIVAPQPVESTTAPPQGVRSYDRPRKPTQAPALIELFNEARFRIGLILINVVSF